MLTGNTDYKAKLFSILNAIFSAHFKLFVYFYGERFGTEHDWSKKKI